MREPVYDRIGVGYARQRRPDPRWQAAVSAALGRARSVVNVGAGTGSYEPVERRVVAVDPSLTMIRQPRPDAAPAVQACAELLPFPADRFDAAMALVTLHHWADWRAGLDEMRRVARRVVVLHFDPVLHGQFWLVRDYLPELAGIWAGVPSVSEVAASLGSPVALHRLEVPCDCSDGFLPAYWRRPEAYLDPAVRQSMSGLQLLAPGVLERGLAHLRRDLADGTWLRRNSSLLTAQSIDVGWRLIVVDVTHG